MDWVYGYWEVRKVFEVGSRWIVLAGEVFFFFWARLGDVAGLWGFDCRLRGCCWKMLRWMGLMCSLVLW